jgi:hypothetical protein
MLIGIGGISTQQRNGSVPFTPDLLSGLQLWLKADAGTLDANNNAITVDNTNLATWQDQSGKAYHVTQSTNAMRPKWRSAANGLNGKPGIEWDGTNKHLERTQKLFTTAISYFVVCKFANTTARLWTADLGMSYPNNFGIEQNTFNSASGTNGFYASGSALEVGGTSSTNPQLFSVYGDTVVDTLISSNLTFRVNKVTKTLTIKNPPQGYFYNYNNITGFKIGTAQPGNNLNMNGFIYEIIVYNVKLSASNVDKVESYLSSKWGI